jgi:ferredoxin
MGTNWGLFLCNCRRTLPVDRERLVLPIVPSVLSFASDPEIDVYEFVARAGRERLDRVVISCCAGAGLFEAAFGASDLRSPKVHFVNLKDSCFAPHADSQKAYAKATRLLRAAMETAELDVQPAYNRLAAGNRIVIATDGPQGAKLAQSLRDVARPLLVVDPSVSTLDVFQREDVYVGRVIEVKGRLSDFQVTIQDVEAPGKELHADQVVIISPDEKPSFKPRTGFHLLINPTETDLDRLAERIRDLIGEFLKPVHVVYSTATCAGGVADQEACGICVTNCPYGAIGRDSENHLRMKIDHMACEGCGACVSACPTTSLSFTEPSPLELDTRLAALLTPSSSAADGERLVVLFHCGEQGRRALEEAGRTPLPYPAGVLPVEVPCLRYVSEANMLAAFRLGAAGVALLGCETCQHGERQLLRQKYDFCRITLDAFDMGRDRLQLITADNGTAPQAITALARFAETLDAAPIRWDGKRLPQRDNRSVIADAITVFIEQTNREPGRTTLAASQPFAFAEVRASGCTLCRSCVNVCPTHAFSLDDGTLSLQFKHISCVACGLCEKVCPENVITLKPEIFFDRNALEYQTVVQDDMVSCAKCGKPYINRRALETVEARLLSLESLLDTFSGNRRSLLRMCPDCRTVVAMMEVEKGWKP